MESEAFLIDDIILDFLKSILSIKGKEKIQSLLRNITSYIIQPFNYLFYISIFIVILLIVSQFIIIFLLFQIKYSSSYVQI